MSWRGGGRRRGRPGRLPIGILAMAVTLAACEPLDEGRPDLEMRAFVRIAAAEDARPRGGPHLETLVAGTRAATPFLRAAAVRGLGRLEDPARVPDILPLLEDEAPEVRGQAADALAQAVSRGSGTEALPPLLRRARAETDPAAAAAVARSLGRLELDEAGGRAAEGALLALSREGAGDAGPRRMVGVALGLESLARARGEAARGSALEGRLEDLTGYVRGGETGARIRTLAFTGLAAVGATDPGVVARGLRDADAAVRRAAATALGRSIVPADALALPPVLADPSPRVRVEGVRILASLPREADVCARLLSATRDDDSDVRLTALDALDGPCPQLPAQVDRLASLAAAVDPGDPMGWHAPAHALHALAGVDPAQAAALLPRHLAHESPFARAWAARTAGRLGQVAALRGLLRDPSDNVLSAALPELVRLQGRGADDALLAAVAERQDPQLVMTAARLLQGTSRRQAAGTAALVALTALSRDGLETHRDARLALMDLLASVGDTTRVGAVEPYLRDYDPAVAERAAGLLLAWTGDRWIAAPRGSQRLPLPTAEEIRRMAESEVEIHMARGGAFRIRLLPTVAPTNAFRLWTLAGAGALEGLTLHRVVPNFVVQGGSPGANEYHGWGAYTRDEVGLVSQWRGTVGLSTRGRDTGDGQIYVNLVDNARLNHGYTILARVTAGMEVVDAIREGDVMERVEILEGSPDNR